LIALGKQWIELKQETYTHRIDGELLPELVQEAMVANAYREERNRETWRHRATIGGGFVVSNAAGLVLGAITALLEALVLAISKAAVVLVPALGMFLAKLAQMTWALQEPINGEIVKEMLRTAAWWGFLAALFAGILYAAYRAAVRHKTQGAEGERNE